MRAIDIAREMKISTSLIRLYEKEGMLPEVPRSSNGYRNYTWIHIEFVKCIRTMSKGFTTKQLKQLMRHIIKQDYVKAYWVINEIQAKLYQERNIILNMKNINQLDFEEISLQIENYINKKCEQIYEGQNAMYELIHKII